MIQNINYDIKNKSVIKKEILKEGKKLKVVNISKSFPGVKALNNVSLEFKSGEIHALVGENGAGKSTLVKIISGVYIKDNGEIYINDEIVEITYPRIASDLGISVIHQEFSLIPELNIAQNIFLGIELANFGGFKLNKKEMHKRSRDILESLDFYVDTKATIYHLSVSEQQTVEIAKALIRDSWLFIMDEPTSALSEKEVKFLFNIIKNLAQKGATIIYISHHLEEVFEISDVVTVLRDGSVVGTNETSSLDQHKVANLMVGKDVNVMFSRKRRQKLGRVVLEVKELTKKGFFKDISFNVREGEVLGLSGLLGSGRSELCRGIYSLDKIDAGDIYLDGQKVRFNSPLNAMKKGVLYSPSDRKKEGIISLMPCDENLTIMSLHWISFLGWIKNKFQLNISKDIIKSLGIKASSVKQKVLNLSGGNQQKVLIGKCLTRMPKVLILDDPTRGIDVGAKEEIYKIIEKLTEEGVAIIIISPEIPELIGISDRVLTFLNGKIINEYSYHEIDQEKILSDILIESE